MIRRWGRGRGAGVKRAVCRDQEIRLKGDLEQEGVSWKKEMNERCEEEEEEEKNKKRKKKIQSKKIQSKKTQNKEEKM